jgi:glutamyl-tRNA synthetase
MTATAFPFGKPLGRLAPSPTGAQHVGNARTYLIAWLLARSQEGQIRLRIEDIDSPRIKRGATDQIFDDFRWLGLDWDADVVVQSDRLPLYQAALQILQAKELVYPCTCTRSDVERAASAPHAGQEGPVYPGTCAHRRAANANRLDKPYCWRFRLPRQEYQFADLFRCSVTLTAEQVGGDFVLWKTDGTPSYQLAVVVDDAEMGITQVVRGDDLIPSTPRQMLLYEALGRNVPAFAHVPLVVGTDGRRLAKRHGDTRLFTLRAAGVTSPALVGLLAWSCGWIRQFREITALELLDLFRLETIPPKPFVLEPALLRQIGYAEAT